MPNVVVLKKELFTAIGKEFSNYFVFTCLADEEFEDLAFEYGIEIEFGSAKSMNLQRIGIEEGKAKEEFENLEAYKIEVAANRYDLLCLEGIADAFRCYLGLGTLNKVNVKVPEKPERILVKSETKDVREFVVGCILRNVTFDARTYNSFIDLQDKLHGNICRRRTLASMGTHDYDKITGPITYEAQAPKDIVFQALKQPKEMNADELFDVYRQDLKLKKFLHIIENKPKYPVFYDSSRSVLSLPPIINSDKTKVTLESKNIFIEMTGTDLNKLNICLDIVASQFSQYCSGDSKFTIEAVDICNEASDLIRRSPQMEVKTMSIGQKYLKKQTGVQMTTDKV